MLKRFSFSVLLLGAAMIGSVASAQTTTDTLEVTATKPAASVTIAFHDPAGAAFAGAQALDASSGSAQLATLVHASYENVGTDSDLWTLSFAATAQDGYSYQYQVDTKGTTSVDGTPQALSTETTNTLQSGAYGNGSGYVEVDGATALDADNTTADQFVFIVTASNDAAEDLSTMITATLTWE